MRVLHISSAKTWRGGEQQLAYLVGEFAAREEVQQRVFCAEGSEMETFCKKQEIPFYTYKKRFSSDPGVALKLSQVCNKTAIELIHCHDAHAHTFAVMAVAFFGLKMPIIVSRRVDFPIGKGLLSRWKYHHSSIRKIVCVSEKIRSIMANDVPPNQLEVVHSGIDPERFGFKNTGILHREFAIPEEMPIVANVAAIAPHKDYFTFVDAVEEVLKRGGKAHFFMIGSDGGEREKVERYISEKKLTNHITLTGFRKDVPQILPEAAIFLITSKTEGLGTSVLDAFACGVPVVATRAGGIPEMVIHERTGLLADVGDASTLAEHVLSLLKNPQQGQIFAANASKKLLDFTKVETARQTLKIYEKTLSEENLSDL